MLQTIDNIQSILPRFDAVVLDIWGVLYNGEYAYSDAVAAVRQLVTAGKAIGVLSNSSKRSAPNLQNLQRLGLPTDKVKRLLSSGEVLYQDLVGSNSGLSDRWPLAVLPLAREQVIGANWCRNINTIRVVSEPEANSALLLLSIPATATIADYQDLFTRAIALGNKLICANLDLISIHGAQRGLGPGAVALHYQSLGGEVVYYGKPHARIFQSMQEHFPGVAPERILMVGDSLVHDIAGSQQFGWQSLLVRAGVHQAELDPVSDDAAQLNATIEAIIERISIDNWPRARVPTYSMAVLR